MAVPQVVMNGLNAAEFELTRPSVTVINDAPVQLTPLNDTAETLVSGALCLGLALVPCLLSTVSARLESWVILGMMF